MVRRYSLAIAAVTLMLALTLFAPRCGAQVIINNLFNQTTSGDSTDWLTLGFTMDGTSRPLLRLIVPIRGTGARKYEIYNDAGGHPGTSLVTVGTTAWASPTQTHTAFDVHLFANANTTYWIVGKSTFSALEWSQTSSTAYTGLGTIPASSAWGTSTDLGANWDMHPLSDGPFKAQIIAANVPEASSVALFAVGGLPLLALARRRKKQSKTRD